MAATATRLLTNFGMAMGIRRVTGATFDPVAGSVSGGTTADTGTVGVLPTINAGLAANFDLVTGDLVAIVDATITPLVSDRLVIGAVVYSIVAVQSISPAGIPVAHRLQVRL